MREQSLVYPLVRINETESVKVGAVLTLKQVGVTPTMTFMAWTYRKDNEHRRYMSATSTYSCPNFSSMIPLKVQSMLTIIDFRENDIALE